MDDGGDNEIPDDPRILDYEDAARRRASRSTSTSTTRTRPPSMCYTSGTTGNPKGVVYSHRSTFLHTHGRRWRRTPSASADPGRRTAGGADVPRQRLGHRAGRAGRRRRAGACPAAMTQAGAGRRCIVDGGRHVHRRRPDHLAGHAAAPRRPRPSTLRDDRLRRLGRAQGAVRGLPRAGRAADPAGLGHDRDHPLALVRRAQRVRRTPTTRPGRPAGPAGHPAPRRGGPHRRRRHPRAAALGRQGHRRAAGARPVVRAGLLQPRRRRGARHRRRLDAHRRRRGHGRSTAPSGSPTAPRT